ncbi:uncharacterized protein HMPREF1541_07920 [Cyphellophora europaea CBS 101466]|uniref:Nuclear cap-binding protein subunit 3 n=1 Tax=Cyphellophora europaea (strain CBS 101466) TaxID=1220924 RepID=W2RML5_CYPE1|nr:uncharacterized protein HMPREF1541_07920 [Cyphellophora europaea CBS 101466]ETN36933.1 hypothetical protein HMPREF1541_07920 [Cyphellophora europaea CBS 101466]
MALAVGSNTAHADDMMDIDIDMDLGDGAVIDDDFQLEEGEEPSFVPSGPAPTDTSNVIPAIYTEDPATEPQWEKIHIRGVDDMHTNDILGFVNDNFPEADAHVQWIDDTSANIVFKTKELARTAILNIVLQPTTTEQISAAPFELRTAKALASRPSSMLTVRVAQAGDRKKKNAREASRYYLMHPDEDPTERMRREFANGRRRRDNGEYERRRFDDRELRRRRHNQPEDTMNDFNASMYDDAPEPERNGRGRDLFAERPRRRSASPGTRNSDEINISDSDEDGRLVRRRKSYRDRTERPPPYSKRDPAPFPRNNEGKELFGGSDRTEGGLHSDRIEAPTRPAASDNREANAAVAKRMRDHLMSAAQTSPRGGHRRSRAMDAKIEEDLVERFGRKSVSMDSTKSGVELFPSNGISIKGSANGGGGELNIKGRADQVKELFPERYKNNVGRELFDEPVREKRPRRRAGDLFD